MTKRCLFILFCATALFARISTAEAYTAIAVASSSSNGGGERYAANYYVWGYNVGPIVSRSTIEQLALKRCRSRGGINPKIVVSTGKPGYFAIAWGVRMGIGHRVGWSGPLPSPEAAAQEAIAKCKERGGTTDPQIKVQWHDYYHARGIPISQ